MRLSRSDVAVSAALLLGAAALMGLFAADLYSTSSRSGEKQLGTIVFKKLTATRKASSGFGWEQMRNDSPVYNADTLRTGDLSAATVNFDDGTSLDMLEDSMLKLDFGGKTKNVEFISGEIGVGSSQKATSYTISSTAGKISVDKGAKATFSREAGKLKVEVNQGGARLVKADGSTQAIATNQELQIDVKSGEASFVVRPIVPISPEPNARLLSFAGGDKAAVDFAWQLGAAQGEGHAAPADGPYNLEVSSKPDFAAGGAAVIKVSALAARVELGSGNWYWRVRDSAGTKSPGKESPVRSFSLDIATPPNPLFPSDGQKYAYRSVKPQVSFAWTAMAEASAYLFEIAADPGFAKPIIRSRTTTASLTVDSLGEGSWYWRVSPVHAYTVIGDAPAATARGFVIAKKAAMGPLALSAPYDGSLYQIQDIGGKGLAFAWAPETEAASYEFVISKKRDLSSPVLKIAATQPYLNLSGSRAEALSAPGSYYWGVSWVDAEGKASPSSAARQLQGIDGSIAVRLSFPPEGYRVADSLVHDTRFTWKSNVNARTVFQLARDSGFRDFAFEETVSAETLIGREWKAGRYYWRLRSYNTDGSVFMETKARSFEVVEAFAPPTLLYPTQGSSVFLHQGDSATFAWAPTQGADYYRLSLRSADDNHASAILEKNFLVGSSLSYPLGNLASGNYKFSIQAFAAEGENTTRIIGLIGETVFTYKRLSYIQLESPADGARVPGLDARAGKEVFVSTLEDLPDEARLEVSTDPAGSNVVASVPDRFGRASVVGLKPGVYYWTVRGRIAGLDVLAKERFRFEVDPVPPPPATELIAPAEGRLYRIEDIDGAGLNFSWAPAPEAISYQLVISTAKDLSSPLLEMDTTRTSVRLSGPLAASLKRPGSWYWGLRWTNAYGDVSQPSPGRELLGVEATNAIRLSFPPEGYRIADSLIAGTSFAWTSKVSAATVFQLARDPDFKDIVHQETAKADTLSGQKWRSGRYYWRLLVSNVDGSTFLKSPVGSFEIVEPLAGPILLSPVPGSTICLREGDSAALSWTPIKGADYYNLSLRSAEEGPAPTLFEKHHVKDSSLACPLGDLPSGSYTLAIQGIASPGDMMTKIVGDIGESYFSEKRLSYIKLESPEDGGLVSGLDALRGKSIFSYDLTDQPDAAELEVSTDPEGSQVVARGFDRSGRASVGPLDPGVYYWTVKGRLAGLDISAQKSYRFSIDPIPPLPPPELDAPARNALIGAAQLRQTRNIFFSWKPVEGANRYILSIFARGKSAAIFTRDDLSSTNYDFKALSMLDKGDFAWTVEARSYDDSGKIEQAGKESGSSFKIDLPALQEAKFDEEGQALYGF
ncbi:MAG TPA: FecR domain-containing protein [Rectinemataceae bacterium]|nr:FecR domain-containing protein [Rectinemataceae bacterium]